MLWTQLQQQGKGNKTQDMLLNTSVLITLPDKQYSKITRKH